MKSKKGFTLVELLVVVLIIGILAAIAVPQYQVAVMKSRVAQIISAISSIAQAQEVYYLANGHYTDTLNDLDIDVKIPADWELKFYNTVSLRKVEARYKKMNNDIQIIHYYNNYGKSYYYPGKSYCFARAGNNFADQVCKSIGTEEGKSDSSGTRYIL